ncbi:unnamed protein product [Musa textilis]
MKRLQPIQEMEVNIKLTNTSREAVPTKRIMVTQVINLSFGLIVLATPWLVN